VILALTRLYQRVESFGTVWCTVYLFIAIACFRLLSLGANDFGNLHELDFQDFEQQPAGEQGK
jgi:hypothetical protein